VRGWPLMWKILIAVSLSISLMVGATSWLALRFAVSSTSQGLEDEVRASLRAYETLWHARENMLASVSLLMSNMPDVRAAFRTGDRATIRDTASDLWSKVYEEEAIFLVADPGGTVIASLGGAGAADLGNAPPLTAIIQGLRQRFPAQGKGFMSYSGRLWQIVVTPVYVDSQSGSALLNVLIAGFPVNDSLALSLRQNTGSHFIFAAGQRTIASTLETLQTAELRAAALPGPEAAFVAVSGARFGLLAANLLDVFGKPIGELRIVRSFGSAQERIDDLRRSMLGMLFLAVLVGLVLSYGLSRRIVEPIERLDQAAAEVARQNYDARLAVDRGDELGRLAQTFNTMCISLQQARGDLIRQERLATIGQFATSIVHDLRNPLAAIYGGAEMLVDAGLTSAQSERVARNMHRASRNIQDLLQDLTNISRGKPGSMELCSLADLICSASERLFASAEAQSVSISVQIPLGFSVMAERARLERVFFNLISNSLEAIPGSGWIRISAESVNDELVTRILDSGPGVSDQIKARLFEPFATAGKRNGLGLGLALSRQAVRNHGGDLWTEPVPNGACFCLRLPAAAQHAELVHI
jgi:signal transduction histidine kinase